MSHADDGSLRGGLIGATFVAVRAPSIVIEEVAQGATPELIVITAADPASLRAASALRSNEAVSFVSALGSAVPLALDRTPAMVIAVGDARLAGCVPAMIDRSRRPASSVAIVAVESLEVGAAIDPLARAFDAVLPVVVARGVDGEAPLARAAAAITAFATADCISLPVGEARRFFVRGGQLTLGAAEADDVVAAVALALAAAGLREGARRVRLLLHIESTRGDLRYDLGAAADALHRAVEIDDFWVTASVSGGPRKGISLVARAAEHARSRV